MMRQSKKQNEITIRRFIEGVYTQEEAKELFAAINKDENNEFLLPYMDEVWESANRNMFTSEPEQKKHKHEAQLLLQKINKKNKTRNFSRIGISVAASVVIFLGICLTSLFVRNIAKENVLYTEISCSFGEKKNIDLPDGTLVILNACSKIVFPTEFTEGKREVKLIGEAFFDVTKDENHSFVVNTKNFDVKVLGTEFNVKVYEDDEISLVSVEGGKVQVNMQESTVYLSSNERVEINSLTKKYKKEKSERTIAKWRSGGLSFSRTPIRDVAKELERAFSYRISFELDQNFDNLISGEHNSKDLKSVLKSIEYTTGLHFDLNEQKKTVLFYK